MKLRAKRVAILVSDGFEEVEYEYPRVSLKNQGASVDLVSINKTFVRSWNQGRWSREFIVDHQVDQVSPDEYDALYLPGGIRSVDQLRRYKKVLHFVRGFFSLQRQKPVGAIGHAPQILVDGGVLKNRVLTSYSSIQKDLEEADAVWIDRPVVEDKGLLTARSAKDLQRFVSYLIDEITVPRYFSPRIYA